MARQLQSNITATFGNLTFYQLYGTYCVRTKSSGGKQTSKTKSCQQPFATAATVAAAIRKMLHPAIPYPFKKEMQSNLCKAVLLWLRSGEKDEAESLSDDKSIQGFQFVTSTSLQSLLLIKVEAIFSSSGEWFIHLPAFIPAQHIVAPKATKEVQLTIACGSYSLAERKVTATQSRVINVLYSGKERKAEAFNTGIKKTESCIIVAALSVAYKIKQRSNPKLIMVQQQAWRAASIVAFTNPTPPPDSKTVCQNLLPHHSPPQRLPAPAIPALKKAD
ncbi:MAG: hypothetical protein M3R72_07435 [Bacteroidota bacterium]|nr:hypothetical protein [Bacteroidota bacterium]